MPQTVCIIQLVNQLHGDDSESAGSLSGSLAVAALYEDPQRLITSLRLESPSSPPGRDTLSNVWWFHLRTLGSNWHGITLSCSAKEKSPRFAFEVGSKTEPARHVCRIGSREEGDQRGELCRAAPPESPR